MMRELVCCREREKKIVMWSAISFEAETWMRWWRIATGDDDERMNTCTKEDEEILTSSLLGTSHFY